MIATDGKRAPGFRVRARRLWLRGLLDGYLKEPEFSQPSRARLGPDVRLGLLRFVPLPRDLSGCML